MSFSTVTLDPGTLTLHPPGSYTPAPLGKGVLHEADIPRSYFLFSSFRFVFGSSLVFFQRSPASLTGGFQEQSCNSCHSSFELNQGRTMGGIFHLSGVPKICRPGMTYPISVIIGQPSQSRWSFELSTRFSASGQQAGELVPVDATTQLKESNGVQYVAHTAEGTGAGASDGPFEFHFNWTAPEQSAGPVIFNASGNAADGANSSDGDYIYTAGAFSGAAAGEVPLVASQEKAQPSRRLNTSSRFAHLPVPIDLDKGNLEIHIEHRFQGALKDSRIGNLFGVDRGANINLGMTCALSDRIAVSAFRARLEYDAFSPVIAFNGIYELHNKENPFWNMSLVGGLEGRDNFQKHYSPVLQLATSFDYGRLRTHVVPTMIFNSREDALAASRSGINLDSNHTLSLGLGGDFAIHPRFSVIGEYVPRLAGFGGFKDDDPAVSGGVRIRTFGHVFTILLTTSQDFTPGRYGVDSTGDFRLGFNIYRRR